MLADQLNHSIYNVSSGRLVRYGDVVEEINKAVTGANVAIPEGRSPNRLRITTSISRLQQDTGFVPEFHIERAVPDYVEWLRDHDR